MKKIFFKGRFIFIPIAVAAFLSLISFVVMQLWNNLLPGILHVGVITFWQAMGIFVLCKILFGFGKGRGGGWGGNPWGGNPWMRQKMQERFRNMTPEQKEMFKQKMRDRACGPWGRHAGDHPFKEAWEEFKDDAQEKKEE
jgi:hypothetical protein